MVSRLGYKIMRYDEDGQLCTLYHGGRKPYARYVWYDAVPRIAADGSGGQEYVSGFHFLWTMDATRAYLKKFRKPRKLVIVHVLVRDMRDKPNSLAWLAGQMMILETIELVTIPYKENKA